MLLLIARLGHVLTTQIHRRFNPGRAVTTTQRRLKRLADAGAVGRFQFHRRDGGGVPMCYVITAVGLELLYARDWMPRSTGAPPVAGGAPEARPPAARVPGGGGAAGGRAEGFDRRGTRCMWRDGRLRSSGPPAPPGVCRVDLRRR